MSKYYLFAPGPTMIPSETLLEMAKPILHHRTKVFEAIFRETEERLKWIFQTKNDVLMLASSGTGAMEGAVVNFLKKGDKVITIEGGKFGQRWGDICKAFGVNAIRHMIEWGKVCKPADIEKLLQDNPDVRAVFWQASETSTGAAHPTKEIAAIVAARPGCISVVDGITAVGAFHVPMDEWKIDILISGSQKALMLPPGLGFAAVSDKAWAFAETSDLPKYYFNFKKERKNLAANTTAYTPAVSLIMGLNYNLKNMQEEGLEKVYARHNRMARACRAAAPAMNLKLLAEVPADSVTAYLLPENVDGGKVTKGMTARGFTIAGGQDHLKGRIFRIGHMGYYDDFDILQVLSAVELTLKDVGHHLELGQGVKAAAEVLGAKA